MSPERHGKQEMIKGDFIAAAHWFLAAREQALCIEEKARINIKIEEVSRILQKLKL
jgi:hypothetical protein